MAGTLAGSTGAAIAWLAAGLSAANAASSCGRALAAVVAPSNADVSLEAVQNIGGSLRGTLAPFLVRATGSRRKRCNDWISQKMDEACTALNDALFELADREGAAQ